MNATDTRTYVITCAGGVRVRVPADARRRLIRAAVRAADDGGTIQAWDMQKLSDDPREHTATSLAGFLAAHGAEVVD